MPSNDQPRWILAAYYWAPYLALAVLAGNRIVEVATHRLQRGIHFAPQVQKHVAEMVTNYAPDRLILETDSHLHPVAETINVPIHTIPIARAKQVLAGTTEPVLHDKFYRHLLQARPELQRLAAIVGDGTTASTNEVRAAQLLAIALGLAAQRLRTLEPS